MDGLCSHFLRTVDYFVCSLPLDFSVPCVDWFLFDLWLRRFFCILGSCFFQPPVRRFVFEPFRLWLWLGSPNPGCSPSCVCTWIPPRPKPVRQSKSQHVVEEPKALNPEVHLGCRGGIAYVVWGQWQTGKKNFKQEKEHALTWLVMCGCCSWADMKIGYSRWAGF